MNKIVLITGSTSGFGKAMAEKFASNNYDVIINGRREDKLETVKKELIAKYNIRALSLPFDIQNKNSVFQAISSLPVEWKRVDVLINNAGLALGKDYFDEALLEDWETMIDTNVKGLLYITKALLPNMIKYNNGHIINIGSTAGTEVYEKGNVYCASKHAVNAISQAMRIDLLRHKIKVTAVHPGAANTEFSKIRFKGNETLAKNAYEGFEPLQAVDVAEVVYYCTTLPRHVCINDLVLTSLSQANSFYLYKG